MKYQPLRDYLSSLPESKTDVTLRFTEIEKIIEAKLPQSASGHRAWWSNESNHVQAKSWLDSGFVVDGVDFSRKIVRFRRGKKPTSKGKQGGTPKPRRTRVELPATQLIDAGFQSCGHWELRADATIQFVGDLPQEPGVYAHVVDGVVMYIGVATMGIKKRIYFYGKPGVTQRTSIRINDLIAKELAAGRKVELVAVVPGETEWDGLPVELAPGLEHGLIRKYMPLWNKRGVAG